MVYSPKRKNLTPIPPLRMPLQNHPKTSASKESSAANHGFARDAFVVVVLLLDSGTEHAVKSRRKATSIYPMICVSRNRKFVKDEKTRDGTCSCTSSGRSP
eukprot:TRINITY_DN43617_c0_g1_i1.p1 TRINITY_DN43617_c0_g1~~TRINITY_DN43617_c0_g1_i1.p1  ORF type:complete len:101 (+),score=7.79 TRINITY_DN43617_c0_g1_i1:367-669(+)